MLSVRHPRKSLFWAAVFWTAALSIMAVQPRAFVLLFLRTSEMFPFAHALAYGTLCFVLCLYFRFERKSAFSASVLALTITFFLGVGTEAAQAFSPDRVPDIVDIQDNMIGALIGTGLFLMMLQSAFLRKPKAVQLELFALPSSQRC